MSNELFTTFSYFSKEEYEKLKQITKTLKEEKTKASQSMLIRVAFNELINNKTIKQINDLIKTANKGDIQMSQELVNNECMTTPEIKAKQELRR